ncbi:hypothetical protein CIPAW_09G109500 [Carya illinoinensis]|uniref:Uncharacterized protein n=1 Tax=Carya illinoinensis TaxID=32201 RepID=A0A8T1PKA5_CARIL|nr:hypothetical protein CIPAW_09G109500 [Carya illinoinensis]
MGHMLFYLNGPTSDTFSSRIRILSPPAPPTNNTCHLYFSSLRQSRIILPLFLFSHFLAFTFYCLYIYIWAWLVLQSVFLFYSQHFKSQIHVCLGGCRPSYWGILIYTLHIQGFFS